MNNFYIPAIIIKKQASFMIPLQLLSLFMSLLLFSCEQEVTITPFYEGIYKGKNESITEFIEQKADTFSNFRNALVVGELDKTLTAFNPHGNGYTLFLPTNEAFSKFISKSKKYNSLQELLEDKDYIRKLIRYHVVNMSLRVNDFPFGALPDTCLSGDLLSISYRSSENQVVPVINNIASVEEFDIELTNGFVHIIDEILEPIVFNNYEWLIQYSEYSLFSQALEITGLIDTFSYYNDKNKLTDISCSMLVEPDDVFEKEGISTIDGLIQMYSPDDQNYTSPSNGLYQFVAYHILEGKLFLNNFEGISSNYNTFSNLPVSIDGTGIDIKINTGVDIFDTLYSGLDTTIVNYIGIDYDFSNVITKNGGIHILNNIMEPFKPNPQSYIFEFFEEPIIYNASQRPNNYEFDKFEKFEFIGWEGTKYLQYIKLGSTSSYRNDDYIQIEGEFSLVYEVPKILPGTYMFQLVANGNYFNNAFIKVLLDGRRIGGNIDLTSGSSVQTFNISPVIFNNYQKHVITIQTLIPGRLTLDCLIFRPVSGRF